MRVLIVDIEGMNLDFALRCAAAGDDVRLYRYQVKHKDRHGEGFKQITLVDDWQSSMPWARDGLIFCTGNFVHLYELDRYRELGYKIFAPSVASAKLEIDRGAGMDAMRAAGIDILPYEEFGSLEEAMRFARKSDKSWVFKPLGDETDKSLTYVADDPADLVGWLARQIAVGKKLKNKCMLQQKIDVLSEIGVSGWMGPEGFLQDKWQILIEHKKLMPGEHGPQTGEMGSIAQYCEDDKLADEMLKPLEPAIRALGHRGDFAVGAIVDRSGKAWPCEFTARAGYPAWFIQIASHRGSPSKWMRDLLDGKDSLRVSYDVAIGVVVAQPRFPYGNSPSELIEGNPISGIEEHWDDIHLVGVMMGKGPKMEVGRVVDGPIMMTAGEYVLVATALGKTVTSAQLKVYRTLDSIHLPNAIYRTDIGDKVIDNLPRLKRFGYLKDMAA